jgi:hypothetical protein
MAGTPSTPAMAGTQRRSAADKKAGRVNATRFAGAAGRANLPGANLPSGQTSLQAATPAKSKQAKSKSKKDKKAKGKKPKSKSKSKDDEKEKKQKKEKAGKAEKKPEAAKEGE